MAGRPGSKAEREARNARIVALAHAGVPQRDIAREVGLKSVRQVQRVLDDAASALATGSSSSVPRELHVPEAMTLDPFVAVLRSVAEQDQVAEEARRLVAETRQDAVRVAALKLMAAVSVQRIDLLARFGALPEGPTWLNELKFDAAWQALSEVATAAGLDIDELRRLTRERVGVRIAQQQSAGTLQVAPLGPAPREREAA
jgi:hypothetical protein